MITLPPSNLPPESVPWGRAVQGALAGVERSLHLSKQERQATNRGQASSAGTLGSSLDQLERQFEELAARRVEYVSSPGFTTPVTPPPSSSTPFSFTRTLEVPPPLDGVPRVAQVLCSIAGTSSNHNAGMATIYASVSGAGLLSTLEFGPFPAPSQSNSPPGWVERGYARGIAQSTGGLLSFRVSGNVFGVGVSGQTTNVGISDIEVAVIYGEKG